MTGTSRVAGLLGTAIALGITVSALRSLQQRQRRKRAVKKSKKKKSSNKRRKR